MPRPDRRAAYLYGIETEWLAAALLRLKGYRILARRFAAAGGEIDLIAERFGTLVFVEVKARGTLEAAQAAISADKCRRIGRAARVFLSRRNALPKAIRLDAIFLAPGRLPRHEQAIGEIGLD